MIKDCYFIQQIYTTYLTGNGFNPTFKGEIATNRREYITIEMKNN